MKYGSILIWFLLFSACENFTEDDIAVDFSDTTGQGIETSAAEAKAVYVAIASMTSPKETYTYYHDLIDYISEKINRPIYIRQKKTYEEVNQMLEHSEVDFAFICSGAYAEGQARHKIKLLVVPVVNGKLTYQAYIITQKDSRIKGFKDFRNRSFAFTDPLSTTGRLYPLEKLIKLGENEKDFFLKTIYTYGHDISIQMVNRGLIDGASVHSLIYEYIAMHHPERVENLKIVVTSGGFGMPPVVTPVSLGDECYNKIKNVLLEMDKDTIGQIILNNLNIDRFEVVGDTIYQSVFRLKEFTKHAVKE